MRVNTRNLSRETMRHYIQANSVYSTEFAEDLKDKR